MNLRRLFLVTVFLPSVLLLAMAQTTSKKLTGKVVDQNGQGLDGATVTLVATDSSIIKVNFTDAEGKYEFENIQRDSIFVQCTYLGYEVSRSQLILLNPQENLRNLPNIAMILGSKTLSEVKIVQKKPFVQRKIDRVVINVDALISNAGTTALEVLEKSPGILIANDNILLKGKSGVIIYIDDRPTYLSNSEVANYLQSIPSGTIETIEIITNPPAKYDAAGNAGIINIRLKKTTKVGWNGGVNLSMGQGRYNRSINSLNFNYKVNKLNFFTNVSYNNINTFQDLTIKRFYFTPNTQIQNSSFIQNSYIKKEIQSTNVKIGVDYNLTKKSVLGILWSGMYNPSDINTTNSAFITDANNQISNYVLAYTPTFRTLNNFNYNINYAYKIDSLGKELTANVDYITYGSKMNQSLFNELQNAQKEPLSKSTLVSQLPSTIEIQSAKIDYVHPIAKVATFEIGAKASQVNTDNTADFSDLIGTVPQQNYEFSNRFRYKEQILAGYLNATKEWKSLTLQAGLRMENTSIDGLQYGNPTVKDSAFQRSYTNLFPTLFAKYNLDTLEKHVLTFNFGRRIERPDYQDLNPFTYPMDRYTYYGGNPFLLPTFSCNIELAHTFKNFLTTSFQYNYSKNVINETNEQRDNIYYSRPGNYGEHSIYGVSISGNFELTPWWSVNVYTEVMNRQYKSLIYNQVLDKQKVFWYFGPNNQFQLSKTWSAEVSANYQTRILVAQFVTIAVWSARVGIAKKLWGGKGSIKLNLNDIFYTNQPGGDITTIANSKASWLSFLDTRVATLSFSYRFSKGENLKARKIGGAEDEQNRVKK